MRLWHLSNQRNRRGAFTLPEMVIASGIVATMILGNMATVYGVRLMNSKDYDRGVISGFMQHYVELIKALPFDQVRPNVPLSGLYSGLDGNPLVALPASTNWVSIAGNNYQTFHPSLVWLTNRAPEMRVTIETSFVGAVAHDRHVIVEVRWDPPLSFGPVMTRRLDLIRVKDL